MEENGGNNREERKSGNNNYFILILAVVLLAAVYFIFTSQQRQPAISAIIEPSVIKRGEVATLSWTSDNIKELYLTIVEDTKKIDFTGSIEVSPMESTIYTFAALGKNGTTIVEKIPLSVVQPLPVVVEPPPLSLIPPKSGFFIIDPPYYYEAELVLWGIEEINFFNYRVTLNLPTGVEIRTPVGGRLSLGTLMNKVGEKPDSNVSIRWNNDEESILSIAGNGLEILRYDEILWDIERKIAAKAGDVVARVKTPGRVQITFWSKKNPLGDEFVKEFWTYLWVVK